jgi:hypothetical protein
MQRFTARYRPNVGSRLPEGRFRDLEGDLGEGVLSCPLCEVLVDSGLGEGDCVFHQSVESTPLVAADPAGLPGFINTASRRSAISSQSSGANTSPLDLLRLRLLMLGLMHPQQEWASLWTSRSTGYPTWP